MTRRLPSKLAKNPNAKNSAASKHETANPIAATCDLRNTKYEINEAKTKTTGIKIGVLITQAQCPHSMNW